MDLLLGISFVVINIACVCAEPSLFDEKHGIKMGIPTKNCDNGKFGLERDWDGSPANYTCYSPKLPLAIDESLRALRECQVLSEDYTPKHHCIKHSISYNETVPTYGDHRPLWPVYGEYTFVPVQRWLHNIEHGAVVMLYDPCAHPLMVNRLRALVTSCIRKHVITPYNKLPRDRPIALVTWGCRLLMSSVDPAQVVSFIKETAMKGPEGKYSKEGQFHKHLRQVAEVPLGSDYEDSKLCPSF